MKRVFYPILALIGAGMAISATVAAPEQSPIAADAAGRVDTVTVNSSYVGSPYKFNVSLPADYFTGSDTTRYPVVYLLNGHGGNQNSWGGLIPLDTVATTYSVIIVTPDGRNSWYWDSPVRPEMQMESFIIDELVPFVDSKYRTIPSPRSRAITGLSMGGHGALWLALRHPDVFANAGSTSGGVDIMPFPGKWNIPDMIGSQEQNREVWRNHTVMSQLDSLENPVHVENIIFDCGTEDFFFKVNNTLDSTLTARRVPHTYITSPGVHNGDYWKKSIYPQLDFFYKHLER